MISVKAQLMAGARSCVPSQGQSYHLCLGQRSVNKISVCKVSRAFQRSCCNFGPISIRFLPTSWAHLVPKVRQRKHPSEIKQPWVKQSAKHAITFSPLQPGKQPAFLLAVASRPFPHGQATKLCLVTKPASCGDKREASGRKILERRKGSVGKGNSRKQRKWVS